MGQRGILIGLQDRLWIILLPVQARPERHHLLDKLALLTRLVDGRGVGAFFSAVFLGLSS
jgi:hypothetical protein